MSKHQDFIGSKVCLMQFIWCHMETNGIKGSPMLHLPLDYLIIYRYDYDTGETKPWSRNWACLHQVRRTCCFLLNTLNLSLTSAWHVYGNSTSPIGVTHHTPSWDLYLQLLLPFYLGQYFGTLAREGNGGKTESFSGKEFGQFYFRHNFLNL